MEFTFRQLTAQDLFPVCAIMKKIGVKELKGALNQSDVSAITAGGKDGGTSFGLNLVLDLAGIIISNLPLAEKEIYAFCASVTGMKAEEVKALPLADFGDLIVQIVKLPDFQDFFKRAFSLTR